MTAKKVSIGTTPTAKPATVDAWVDNHAGQGAMKRLTFDIPEDLHRAIKVQCAQRGTKIADEIRELLSQKYGFDPHP